MEAGRDVTAEQLNVWNEYKQRVKISADEGIFEIPDPCQPDRHNGHIFWIKPKNKSVRDVLLTRLYNNGIMATFHYIFLHSAPARLRYGRCLGDNRCTTLESERLLRLPIFFGLKEWDRVVETILNYFE